MVQYFFKLKSKNDKTVVNVELIDIDTREAIIQRQTTNLTTMV